MLSYKWIRPDMDLYLIPEDGKNTVELVNTGNLDEDFRNYAYNFYDAAELVVHYLAEEAALRHDIAKLDLWYFPMVYLYRQCLELLLKACIFQTVRDSNDRKNLVGEIRHDLKQAFDKLVEIRKLNLNENAKWLMQYLFDISSIDRESDMFRYPFGCDFKVLFNKQTNISLVATHDNMNKAFFIISEIFLRGNFSEQDYKAYKPRLIIEGGNYYQQSVVGYKYSEYSFYPYFSAYKEVADFLKKAIIDSNKPKLFLPMCYLYRNTVELGLKRLILEDSHIDNTKAVKIIKKKKHSIQGLWNSIEEDIKECADESGNDTTLEDANRYISTFHNFDNASDLFRYPCNKMMEPYFLTSQKFDIDNVASCFEELCNFLDSIDDMLSIRKEYEADMAADLASYYD